MIDHLSLLLSILQRTILMGNKFECKEAATVPCLQEAVCRFLLELVIYLPFRFKYILYNRIGRWSIVTKDSLSLIMPYTTDCWFLLNFKANLLYSSAIYLLLNKQRTKKS